MLLAKLNYKNHDSNSDGLSSNNDLYYSDGQESLNLILIGASSCLTSLLI